MPSDTSPHAAEMQAAIYRRMTPGERVEVTFELSEETRRVSLDGLRSPHPEMIEEELHWELIRLMYGFVRRS